MTLPCVSRAPIIGLAYATGDPRARPKTGRFGARRHPAPRYGSALKAIQRAFGFLERHAWNGLQVDHGRLDVAMPQQPLNGLEVVIGEQQMTCEGMSERVGRNPFGDGRARRSLFDGSLDIGFVKMVAPLFTSIWNEGERGCREEPLPDELPGGVLVFLLELPGEEDAGIAGGEILGVQASDEVHLLAYFREGAGRKWDRAVLLAFPVVDGQEHGIEVEALNPQPQAS